jgi:hypothetical protein
LANRLLGLHTKLTSGKLPNIWPAVCSILLGAGATLSKLNVCPPPPSSLSLSSPSRFLPFCFSLSLSPSLSLPLSLSLLPSLFPSFSFLRIVCYFIRRKIENQCIQH